MKIAELLRNKQLLSFAGNMVMALINVLTNSLLYHHLSKKAMGSWVFFQIVFIFIDSFRTGFLQTSFIKFYAGTDEERGGKVLGSAWYIGLVISGVVVAANLLSLFALPFVTDMGFIVLIEWTGLFTLGTLPIVMATWLLQAQHRYLEILYIRIVNQCSFILVVLALIYFKELKLETVLISNFLCNVLTCLVVMLCKWTGIRSLPRKCRDVVKELYLFGKFSVGTSISANLLRSSDAMIIKFALSTEALAIYNVAQNLMNLLDIPLRSFVTTGMTSIAAAENRNDRSEVLKIFNKYTGVLTVLFIPAVIGMFLTADIAVRLLAGKDYIGTPAANLLRIFLAFAMFLPIDRFVGVTLDVMHMPKVNLHKVLLMLGVNVAGDMIAVYLMNNIYGIAIASIPTFVVGALFGYVTLRRYLKIELSELFSTGWTEAQGLLKMAMSKVGFKPVK